MNVVRYIVESHSIVAGPSAANCMTDSEVLDDDAYRPTAAESTRLRRGSETQMTTVDATKKNIFLYDGRPTNDDIVFGGDDDDSFSIAPSLSSFEVECSASTLCCRIGLDCIGDEKEGLSEDGRQ